MRTVLQRVSRAQVDVDAATVAAIGPGLVALVGITHDDTPVQAATLARKVHSLRILADERSLDDDPDAAILVVSQFTLYGQTRKGRRPSWSAAAPRELAEPVIEAFVAALRELGADVHTGVFGADMRVELVNEGPFTVLVEA